MDGVRTTSDYDPKMIEAFAHAYADLTGVSWADLTEDEASETVSIIASVLSSLVSALPLTPEALNALWRGEAVVVPKVRTRAMMMTASPFIEDSWPAMLAASPYTKKE